MSDKYDGVHETSNNGSSTADFDLYYADMPGQYIDDILKSDLPGSHLDKILYGEMPGSHLDVVLESPLPGGSTDELLFSDLPGTDPYGSAAALSHPHSHSVRSTADVSGKSARESYEQRRRDRQLEESRREFVNVLEQSSLQQARESQNRINRESRRGFDDLDNLWNSMRKNIEANRNEKKYKRMQRRGPVSTPVSRARNTSQFARGEIRKEKPKKSLGITGVFFTMIILITVFNRLIVPLVEHFSSSEETVSVVENTSDSGEFYLSDSEFDSLVAIENNIAEAFKNETYLFEMTNEELADRFAGYGFETDFKDDENSVYGNYVDGTTWVDMYRNDDYIGFSCNSSSEKIDTDVISEALTESAPVYVSENLGRDVSEIGLDRDLLKKFSESVDENARVTYYTDNFSIYYYEYEESVSFYLYGEEEETYISIDTNRNVLESIIMWY